jgi:hypothetical protein
MLIIGHEKSTHILKKILPHNYKLLHHFQEKSNESRQKEKTKPTHREDPLLFSKHLGPSSLTQCSNWIVRQSLRRKEEQGA